MEASIDEKFKKRHVFAVTVVGGEPMMRPDVVELFAKEFPKRSCIVTNGNYPLKKFKDLYFCLLYTSPSPRD